MLARGRRAGGRRQRGARRRRSGAVVSAMLHDPRVRKLSFTGSTEVGRILLAQAADQVLSMSMELGGNAPFVVFEDADLDAAVEGAMIAKMRNGGEACTAANRFYVARRRGRGVRARLAERMGALRLGPGSTTAPRSVRWSTRTRRRGARARSTAPSRAGATALAGGDGAGAARLLLPADRADRRRRRRRAILDEEIFGPVAPIVTFTDEDEAVRARQRHRVRPGRPTSTPSDLARGLRRERSASSPAWSA